jgi:hypothetical protein
MLSCATIDAFMKKLLKLFMVFLSILIGGCLTNLNQTPSYIADASPREGWATDPILSYRLYSYYPVNFNPGGFNGYGETSRVWTGSTVP